MTEHARSLRREVSQELREAIDLAAYVARRARRTVRDAADQDEIRRAAARSSELEALESLEAPPRRETPGARSSRRSRRTLRLLRFADDRSVRAGESLGTSFRATINRRGGVGRSAVDQ